MTGILSSHNRSELADGLRALAAAELVNLIQNNGNTVQATLSTPSNE